MYKKRLENTQKAAKKINEKRIKFEEKSLETT